MEEVMQWGWSQGPLCVMGAESGRRTWWSGLCLIGKQDRGVGGGAGNLQESFSRGSD